MNSIEQDKIFYKKEGEERKERKNLFIDLLSSLKSRLMGNRLIVDFELFNSQPKSQILIGELSGEEGREQVTRNGVQ